MDRETTGNEYDLDWHEQKKDNLEDIKRRIGKESSDHE